MYTFYGAHYVSVLRPKVYMYVSTSMLVQITYSYIRNVGWNIASRGSDVSRLRYCLEAPFLARTEVVHEAHTYCVQALPLSIGRWATVQVSRENFRSYPLRTSETLYSQPCYGCPVCDWCGNLLMDNEFSPHNLVEKVGCWETARFIGLCVAQWACHGRHVWRWPSSVHISEWLSEDVDEPRFHLFREKVRPAEASVYRESGITSCTQ
jgi:hypothetical protein